MDKRNKVFFLTTTIISLIFMLIGTTFSYFTVKARSNLDAVAADAGKIRIGLSISPLYTGLKLIPMHDTDLDTAYAQNCIDDLGNGACVAYTLAISNFDIATEVEGTIDFTIDGIENLSYIVLDEQGNRYTSISHIDSSDSTNLSLGPSFTLLEGSSETPTTKTFTLIIWLTETGGEQDDTDADGRFTANVTYSTSESGRLTASIEGMKADTGGE